MQLSIYNENYKQWDWQTPQPALTAHKHLLAVRDEFFPSLLGPLCLDM